MNKKLLYTAGGVLALLLWANRRSVATWYHLVKEYFVDWETYSAKPYWDVERWSWGYGTRVPGSIDNKTIVPGGTISQVQAFKDAYQHVQNDFDYLQELISVPLTGGQWAALLSFSYNLGPGSADNLVANINSRNWPALRSQWLLYNKAGGKYNQHLADRREYEVSNFFADL